MEPDADTDTDSDSDTDADSDTDTDSDSDSDTDSDTDSDSDGDTDPDTDINCIDDQSEPNDTLPDAMHAGVGNSYYTVSSISDDYWRFELLPGGTATFRATFTPLFGEAAIEFETGSGATVGHVTTGADYSEAEYLNGFDFPLEVFAHVTAASGTCVPYTLNSTVVNPPPCVDDAYEPNDDQLTALSVTTPAELALVHDSEVDWLRVSLFPGQTKDINVLFTHADQDIDVRVREDGGTWVGSGISSTDNETVTITNDGAQQQDYLVKVYSDYSVPDCVRYTLEVVDPPVH